MSLLLYLWKKSWLQVALCITLIQTQSHSSVQAARDLRRSPGKPPAPSWVSAKFWLSCPGLFSLGCWDELAWPRAKLPPRLSFTTLPQKDRGRKWDQKSSWEKMKTGRSLTSYRHGQNRLDLRKINLLTVKIDLVGRKQKQKVKHLPQHLLLS